LEDPREIDQWRREGAEGMARAVELGADADRSLAASSLFGRFGEKDAAIKQLQRAWALTDDEDVRAKIRVRLQELEATVAGEAVAAAWDASRRKHAPFVKPALYKLLGPQVPTLRCVGLAASVEPECAHRIDDQLP
jgi:hypothetical protein